MPLRYIAVAVLSLLAGCQGTVLPAITPYRMDIQQGNYVTQEMISKLQPGMTRSQVRFALGTPLVVDPFHSDRWDYVYLYQKAGTVTEQRRIVVLFKDDKLVRIEGDVVPAGPPGAGGARADKPAPASTAAKPQPAPPPASKPEPAAPPSDAAPAAAGSGSMLSSPPPKPEAAAPAAAQSGAAESPAARSEGTRTTIGPRGQPVKVEAGTPPAKEESKEGTKEDQKAQEERGFFGRMLEKIGL